MKSFFSDKTWIILLVILAFFGLVILAAGLGEVEFTQPFSTRLERSGNTLEFSDMKPGSGGLFRYLIPALFLLIFLLMLGPARPQRGNSIVNALMRAIAFILFFTLVMVPLAKQSGLISGEMLEGMPGLGMEESIEEFSPLPVTSGWAFWISSLLTIIFGVFVVFAINRAFDRWFKPKPGVSEIAEIVRTALTDLSSEKPSNNVVIRCYLEMNKVVSETRGYVREKAMTPTEFAVRLEGLGLPYVAVHGLTDVFERARYGGLEAGKKEIKEAKRCLTEILEACKTKD